MAIVEIGKQSNKDIKEFQGIAGVDDKNSLLLKLTDNNLGSSYTELKQDASGIEAVYVLNKSESTLTWYKL
ncbi:hypothetical protein [Clostridium senegalense]